MTQDIDLRGARSKLEALLNHCEQAFGPKAAAVLKDSDADISWSYRSILASVDGMRGLLKRDAERRQTPPDRIVKRLQSFVRGLSLKLMDTGTTRQGQRLAPPEQCPRELASAAHWLVDRGLETDFAVQICRRWHWARSSLPTGSSLREDFQHAVVCLVEEGILLETDQLVSDVRYDVLEDEARRERQRIDGEPARAGRRAA